mgnify:FL=1
MKIGIIILCRYDSSRLPGKILKRINGKPVLDYIIERLKLVDGNYQICIATSKYQSDVPLVNYCKQNGISFFRGNKRNVAKRFLDCSLKMKIDYAVRINGDNIFTDPSIITKMLNITRSNKWIFITNVLKRTFPEGISVEIIKVSYLKEKIALFDKYDKEHVMPYFYRNLIEDEIFNYYNTGKDLSTFKLALDTKKDFLFLSSICDLMEKPHSAYYTDDIINIIKVNKLTHE